MRKSELEWISNLGKNEKLNIFYGAPTIILVCSKKGVVSPWADVCAAIQNMLIAAESMNIGSCWNGFCRFYFNNPESYKKLGIPEGYEGYYGVAIGYKPEGYKANPPQRKYDSYYNIIK